VGRGAHALYRLHRLSLTLAFDPTARYIKLHDVIRQYLVGQLADRLAPLHGLLLAALRPPNGAWADLARSDPYLWDHLAHHLRASGNIEELCRTVRDLRYLAVKTLMRTAMAAESDLISAEQAAPGDVALTALRRSFVQSGHILNHCDTLAILEATLYSRLPSTCGMS
jgi:hypothetical protein